MIPYFRIWVMREFDKDSGTFIGGYYSRAILQTQYEFKNLDNLPVNMKVNIEERPNLHRAYTSVYEDKEFITQLASSKKDICGKQIYEGDIVRVNYSKLIPSEKNPVFADEDIVGEVVFEDDAFFVKFRFGEDGWRELLCHFDYIEILGTNFTGYY